MSQDPARLYIELKKRGLFPSKKLGQHFLFDRNILKKIVASASPFGGKWVLEIGPGPGTLTLQLLQSGAYVVAVEKDVRMVNFLKEYFQPYLNKNLYLVNEDALNFDPGKLSRSPEILIANLPYNIAATLLVDYLVKYPFLKEYVVMVQREVALRLGAFPGSENYSSLTVKIQAVSDVELLFKVAPGSFSPPPKVESQVIRLIRNPKLPEERITGFFKFVDLLFAHRRKTLLNNFLMAGIFNSREEAERLLEHEDISLKARPEELSVEQYIKLFFRLKEGTASG